MTLIETLLIFSSCLIVLREKEACRVDFKHQQRKIAEFYSAAQTKKPVIQLVTQLCLTP